MELDREQFIRSYPLQSYIELDKASTIVDKLYHETSSPVYKPPVLVPIMLQMQPSMKLQKRYGIETETVIIGLLSNGWIAKHAPMLRPSAGDRIQTFNKPYVINFSTDSGTESSTLYPDNPNMSLEVVTVKYWDYFGNSQVPLHRVLTLKNTNNP